MTERTGASREKDAGQADAAPEVRLPVRLDMRRAFDIYVSGRNRTLGPAEKGSIIGGSVQTPYAAPSEEGPELAAPVRETGVSVPSELQFDRNAGIWRRSQRS